MRPTNAERVLLWRRREGLNQTEAAAWHNVSYTTLSKIERGKVEPSWSPHPLRLRGYEKCLLYRRRCNKTQAEVAADLGCCRYWVHQMEQGEVPCDILLWYWEQ